MRFFSDKIIDSQALIYNYQTISKLTNKKIICVVKANAYGHEADKIVRILKKYCNYFAVQNLDEAIFLRKKFKDINILIVGKCSNFALAIDNNLIITVDSVKELYYIKNLNKSKQILLNIKINCGMNRLGVDSELVFLKMLKIINSYQFFNLLSVSAHFNHLSNKEYTKFQIEKINNIFSKIDNKSIDIVVGGSLALMYNLPDFITGVRCGIALYGYKIDKLKKVLTIRSKVIKIHNVKKGEFVGYDNSFVALKKCKVAIIPLGYADGIVRNLNNNLTVKIGNNTVKQIGKICMDMFMCDISGLNVKENDVCEVFYDATLWAQQLDTIEYEILTNFNNLRANIIVK